jgi:RNA polymerase sigma-70 factor (ECF subfamily)
VEGSPSTAPISFATLFETYSDYVWRTVRRLGVRERDVDDATQQVLIVAARKLGSIRPGSERAFLFQTALRVSGTLRRTYARRREEMREPDIEAGESSDGVPCTEELLGMRRARQQLDMILDQMPLELRAVFVLHELEEETMADIAETLGIPAGTAASRLRRARALFYEGVARESPSDRSVR